MIPVPEHFPPVTIIIPSGGLARYTSFEMAIEALHTPEGSGIQRSVSVNLASNVNEAIRTTSTPLVWFIDDDHQFEPEILLRLIAHDVPVVGPLNIFSRPPFQPVLFKATHLRGQYALHADFETRATRISELFRDGYSVQAQQEIANLIMRGPVTRPTKTYELFRWDDLDSHAGLFTLPKGGTCGRAGLLVKREVFEQIPPPWFELGQTNSEEPGEDMHFCSKIQEFGFDICVDMELINGHTSPCTAFPYRDATGRWAVRLMWENDQSIVIPRWPFGGQRAGAGESASAAVATRPPAVPHPCADGFMCQQHPDKPYPHDLDDGTSCAGPATACTDPACPFWGKDKA